MAKGDYQLSIRTYVADEIINTCLVSTPTELPKLLYYVPVNDPSQLIVEGDPEKVVGVHAPTATTEDIPEEKQLVVKTTTVDNNGVSTTTSTPFVGTLKSGHVTRMPFDGVNPPRLKIRIAKEIDKDNIGGQANVFYICDDKMRIWVVIHVTPHQFVAGQKWEIVTDLVVADSEQISNFVAEPNPFEYKTASEILLPDLIIGNSADLANGKASHTVDEFQNIDFQHENFNLAKRIIFLEDVDALTADVSKLGGNMDFSMENPDAVLPLAGHTLSLNGDNIHGQLRVSGLADNGLVLNGTDFFLRIVSDNDNGVDLTNARGFVVHNGKLISSSAEFTDAATVPTAQDGDVSKKIANTEFVKNQLAHYDVLRLKGAIDASANPNYPAANAGDFYVVSVAGKIGGPSGIPVEPQDTMLCIVDESAEDDHTSVGNNWILGQVNTDMDLEGMIRDHLAEKDIVRLKGPIDATPMPDYPAADAGDMYVIEKAGRIGGESGPQVEKNDTVMCLKDETLAGDHAAVGSHWMIGQVNTDLDLGTAFAGYLKINKEDHGWTNADIGKMVIKQIGGGEGAFLAASADSSETAEVVGHISKIDSTDQFTINRIGHLFRSEAEWDALCGTTGGLSEGDVYFLNTSGGTSYTKDISGFLAGNVDMPAFIALSARDVWFYGYRGAEIGGSASYGTSFAATDFSGNVMTITHNLNTMRPIIRVFDENNQPVEDIPSRPSVGNELNAQDIGFSDEMIAVMGSSLWHVIVIGTGVPYTTTTEVLEYEPEAEQYGVKILPNGAIYKFDDWHGVEGFLTGDHAFVVPYKKSLSNVFTGFEIVGWEGNSTHKKIKTFPGLQWIKNRTIASSHRLADLLRNHQLWYPDTIQPQFAEANYYEAFSYNADNALVFGNRGATNGLGSLIISWNWHYPMAKAWHAPGEIARKVPTPWGMVASVESNANSGLTGDQVVTELYNPLTGNGCLLYAGTGTNRTLDISGRAKPDWIMTKRFLGGDTNSYNYHGYLNGGVNPEQFALWLNSDVVEKTFPTFLNNSAPTFNTIAFGATEANKSGDLCIAYYFAPLTGLQNFGGYTGNARVNNQATGCKDGMFFIKCRYGIASRGWNVFDSFRGDTKVLRWNLLSPEITYPGVGFNSTSGIELNTSDSDINSTGGEYIYGHFGNQLIPQGNFDVYPANPILANNSNNKVKIIFEYKGSAFLNSELQVYASRETVPNWVQGTLIKVSNLSGGYQLLSAEIDISSNANDTHMRWRLASNESTYTEHNIKNLKITWK